MATEIGTSIRKVQTPDGVIHPIYDERIPAVDTAPTSGSTNVVTSGGVYDSIQSVVGNGVAIYDVEDNGSTTAGTWLGSCPAITSYTDGLTIRYKLHVAGASTTTLNINGLGAKTVYRVGSTKLTTQYPVDSYLILYYAANLHSGSWQVYTDYDANTNAYVRQYQAGQNAAGTAPKYPLLARYNVTNHNGSYEATYARYHTDATVNTSTGEIEANGFIKTGGTSSQFLKADGSVDSNTYVASTDLGNYVPKSGSTTMSDDAELVFPSEDWDEQNDTGYKTEISHQGVYCYDSDDGFELHMDATDGGFISGSYSGQHTSYVNGAIGYSPSSSTHYTYSFPSKSGRFAMTSDIPTIPTIPSDAVYPFCIQALPNETYPEDLTQIEIGSFNVRDLEELILPNGRPVFLVIDGSRYSDCSAIVLQLIQCDFQSVSLEFADYRTRIVLSFDPSNIDSSYNINGQDITVSVYYPLNAKQNVISDLSTIRSGAALGTTSLQPGDVPTFYTGTTDPSSSLGSNGDIYLKISS